MSGSTALVTGASRGTGRGIAIELARAGANVVLAARNKPSLEEIVAEIEGQGGTASAVVADLASRAGCDALVAQCGAVDILVNNAALTTVKMQPTIVPDDAYWQDSFQLNLWAPLALMQGLCPGMIDRGGGVVINISSTTAQRVVPHYAPYAASKAALETMSRVAALDMA
ncbi:MAG: SDR family NAD(P)-dependent oxidoreductase, partial [Novosphingobium sp.]